MHQLGGLSDADLVRWALGATTLDEHKAAFEAIANRYRQEVLRQCGSWYPDRDTAQDVGQATFEAAFTLLAEGRGPAVPEKLGGWLIEIARRRGQEHVRKRKPAGVYWAELPEGRGLDETEDDDEPRSGSAARRAHVTRLVDRVVGTLTEHQQDVYQLRFVEELTGRQVAARLGITDKAASNEATIVQGLIADGFGALILMQEGRTYCPNLARILDDAAATRATAVASSAFATAPDMYVFTTVLRQRIVNHFNDCNVCDNCRTCDDKRRQLAGPYAPALIPILFAAEFRDRIDEVIRHLTARAHPGENLPGQPISKQGGPRNATAAASGDGSVVGLTAQSSRESGMIKRQKPHLPHRAGGTKRPTRLTGRAAVMAVVAFVVVAGAVSSVLLVNSRSGGKRVGAGGAGGGAYRGNCLRRWRHRHQCDR